MNMNAQCQHRAPAGMVPEEHVCTPVSNTAEGIGSMGTHLSYNTHFKKWMTIGSLGTPSEGVSGVIQSGNWSYEAIVSDTMYLHRCGAAAATAITYLRT